MFLSIIIPAFNEERVIESTINKILAFLKDKDFDFEIIVVNDGSIDNTLAQISNLPIKIVNLTTNQGKGMAVKIGMQNAQGDYKLFMDADNATDICELDNFLKYIKDYDIIIANRALNASQIIIHQPFYKELFGKMGNFLIRAWVVKDISDTQCGFKLFNKKAAMLFAEINPSRWGFDVQILALAQKNNYKIKQLPIKWQDDGKSAVRLIDYIKTFWDIINPRG